MVERSWIPTQVVSVSKTVHEHSVPVAVRVNTRNVCPDMIEKNVTRILNHKADKKIKPDVDVTMQQNCGILK